MRCLGARQRGAHARAGTVGWKRCPDRYWGTPIGTPNRLRWGLHRLLAVFVWPGPTYAQCTAVSSGYACGLTRRLRWGVGSTLSSVRSRMRACTGHGLGAAPETLRSRDSSSSGSMIRARVPPLYDRSSGARSPSVKPRRKPSESSPCRKSRAPWWNMRLRRVPRCRPCIVGDSCVPGTRRRTELRYPRTSDLWCCSVRSRASASRDEERPRAEARGAFSEILRTTRGQTPGDQRDSVKPRSTARTRTGAGAEPSAGSRSRTCKRSRSR